MSIDPRYVPAFSIETVMLDKDTGAPLSGGIVHFEQDNNRGIPKPIYQITGNSPNYTYTQLPNPMTLTAIGTFEDTFGNPVVPYFFPYDGNGDPEYYYVWVESSGFVPQFAREAVPYISEQITPSEAANNFANELSNPQFSEVLFDTTTPSYAYTITGAVLQEINIAPNWDMIVTGTGSVTLAQSKPTGSLNRPTNPGTLLNITSSGLTVLKLRQRLYGSPNLFGSGFVSSYLVGAIFGGTAGTLTIEYAQSNGTLATNPVTILTAQLTADGNYNEFSNSAEIPVSNSTDTFPNAYIDIILDIPVNRNVEITSIQVVGTGAGSVDAIPYDQQTNNRQIDFEFHYFKPLLEFKPISSLLTAWDFPLNPAQEGAAVTMSTTAQYLWDQTIGQSVVGNIAVDRNTVTGGIQATTTNANEAFYYMQYLSGDQAKKMLGTPLAVNLQGYRVLVGGDVNFKIYLYRGSSSATFPVLPTSIGSSDALGNFTLSATNWTEIPRGNRGQAQGTLDSVDATNYAQLNDAHDFGFSGWMITDKDEIADTDKFAIVVTFSCPTTASVVVIDSISVVPGDIPTRPAPQTFDQVLEECQYYWETSKAVGVPLTTSDANGAVHVMQQRGLSGGTGHILFGASFGLQYKTVKRTAALVHLYTEGGLIDNVTCYYRSNGAGAGLGVIPTNTPGNYVQTSNGTKGLQFLASAAGALYTFPSAVILDTDEAYISFHYSANARLGQV